MVAQAMLDIFAWRLAVVTWTAPCLLTRYEINSCMPNINGDWCRILSVKVVH